MISQLFSLSLRAVIVAATLPTPPALGAALTGPSIVPGSTMSEFVANRDSAPQLSVHPDPTPASADTTRKADEPPGSRQ